MNETGTINDAAAVFSALSGDQVIELLSRLETHDAQRLLATAAAQTPSAIDLEQASRRLERKLNQPENQQYTPLASASPNQDSHKQQKRQRPAKSPKRRKRKPSTNRSLDFLTDMPDHQIQLLLSKVSTACWAPALESASGRVREVIFSNVAPAIERLLRQEIDSFDGNDQVARISRQKIIAAANALRHTDAPPTRRKAG